MMSDEERRDVVLLMMTVRGMMMMMLVVVVVLMVIVLVILRTDGSCDECDWHSNSNKCFCPYIYMYVYIYISMYVCMYVCSYSYYSHAAQYALTGLWIVLRPSPRPCHSMHGHENPRQCETDSAIEVETFQFACQVGTGSSRRL